MNHPARNWRLQQWHKLWTHTCYKTTIGERMKSGVLGRKWKHVSAAKIRISYAFAQSEKSWVYESKGRYIHYAMTCKNHQRGPCAQRRLRSASAQSEQSVRWPLKGQLRPYATTMLTAVRCHYDVICQMTSVRCHHEVHVPGKRRMKLNCLVDWLLSKRLS